MKSVQLKHQLRLARLLSLFGYLLPTYAALHWHTSSIEDIAPSIPLTVTLVLSVVFVLAGQTCEWNLSERRSRSRFAALETRIAAHESAGGIPLV
jgi:hypothetical protein